MYQAAQSTSGEFSFKYLVILAEVLCDKLVLAWSLANFELIHLELGLYFPLGYAHKWTTTISDILPLVISSLKW